MVVVADCFNLLGIICRWYFLKRALKSQNPILKLLAITINLIIENKYDFLKILKTLTAEYYKDNLHFKQFSFSILFMEFYRRYKIRFKI